METRKLSKAERKELYRAECNYCVNPDASVEDKEILRLQKERVPAIEIAARLNVAPELVRYRLRRAGFEPVPAPKFLEAERLHHDIVRLHQQGYPAKRIAEQLDTNLSYVYKRLREAELEPRPSHKEVENTLRAHDEIVRLGKEGVPRYGIAKRTGSTWPLVSEALEKSSVRPVAPACREIASWASTLSPLIDKIREAHPNTKPILKKVDQLEKELADITEAVYAVQDKLPWRGVKADEERWCLADISYLAYRSLDVIDALKGCVKALDIEKLPRLLEQAETCIKNISSIMSGAISEAGEAAKR